MPSLRRHHRDRSTMLRNLIVLLSLVAILIAGSAAMLHTHATGAPTDARCALCGVAHLSAVPVALDAIPATAEAVFILPPQPDAVAAAAHFHFSLYVRPPPPSTPRA